MQVPFYAGSLSFENISRGKCTNPLVCIGEKTKMLPHNIHECNDSSLRCGFVFATCPVLRKRLAPKHWVTDLNN